MLKRTKWKELLTSEDGVSTTEYAVMLAIIIIACIGAVLSTGDVQRALFFDTADIFSDSVGP